MAENKTPLINPDASVKDSGKISITINQVESAPPPKATTTASQTPQAQRQQRSEAWPPSQLKAPAQEQIDEQGTFSMANVMRRAKYLSKNAISGIGKLSDKILDIPLLKPLKELKGLAAVLLVIMAALLLVSFICFFRNALLWGILGILVDIGVGVGLYFGVQAMPTKVKLFGIAGIAVTGAMLVFCFIRMILGR